MIDPGWLATQRWFRAKHRAIAAISEVDRAPVGPGALDVVDVSYADGGAPDRYLVPTVAGREPADGEGFWAALVEAIAAGGDLGPFSGTRLRAIDSGSLAERRLGVEQSNTSVVLGDRLILPVICPHPARRAHDGRFPSPATGRGIPAPGSGRSGAAQCRADESLRAHRRPRDG